jgi:hypothetical protein
MRRQGEFEMPGERSPRLPCLDRAAAVALRSKVDELDQAHLEHTVGWGQREPTANDPLSAVAPTGDEQPD